MTALIIGAAGFVGRYLIDELNSRGYQVYATKLEQEIPNHKQAEFLNCDITRQQDIDDVIQKANPDCIFHLAAQSSVSASWNIMAKTFEINTLGAVKLLSSVNKLNKAIKVLLIGSSEEYGFSPETKMPVDENTAVNPANPYAISKAAQTMIGKMYYQSFGLTVTMVRAFNHIGPYQPLGFVVSDLCSQIAQIEKSILPPVLKVGNLSAKRDFSDVRDIVKGYADCITKGTPGEIYNIGSGKAISVEDILKLLLSMSETKIEVIVDESKFRPVDVPVVEANISKARKDFSYKPTISLESTLKETLDYWRDNV